MQVRYFSELGNITLSNPDSLHNSIQIVLNNYETDKENIHPIRPEIKQPFISKQIEVAS